MFIFYQIHYQTMSQGELQKQVKANPYKHIKTNGYQTTKQASKSETCI